LDFPLPPTHFPSPLSRSIARPRSRARPTHTHTHTMAGRDPGDDRDDTAPPAQRARPDDDPPAPVSVCGLEVGLLDVGRIVALNGYPEACGRLAFNLERDLEAHQVRAPEADSPDEPLSEGGRGARISRSRGGPLGPPAPPFPPTFFNVKGCIAQSVEHRSQSSRMNPLPPFPGATQGRKRVGVVLCARR
jgi:hypothetical protein